jgi:hypothetical protein
MDQRLPSPIRPLWGRFERSFWIPVEYFREFWPDMILYRSYGKLHGHCRRFLAEEGTTPRKGRNTMRDNEQRRKAMFFAYAMGLSVNDIARALNIGRVQALRILQEDRWMYDGLTRVREYDRELFAKSQPRRQARGAPKSRSVRVRQKGRRRATK